MLINYIADHYVHQYKLHSLSYKALNTTELSSILNCTVTHLVFIFVQYSICSFMTSMIHRTFVPENFRSRELSFPETFVPRNFHPLELSFPDTEVCTACSVRRASR